MTAHRTQALWSIRKHSRSDFEMICMRKIRCLLTGATVYIRRAQPEEWIITTEQCCGRETHLTAYGKLSERD